MPVQAPPPPTGPKPKQQSPQAHAQQIARQVLNEPVEILKDVGRQVSGDQRSNEWQNQTSVSLPQTGEQPAANSSLEERARQERAKAQGHMQAFQEELHVIQRLQKERADDIARLRAQEEEAKKSQKEQSANQKFGPLEVIGRIKRGMMGGGKTGHVHKKQRSAELVKTPSN